VLLYLVVATLENLKPIRECSLSGLGVCEVVDYLQVWESLLDNIIGEVDDRITRGPDFSLDTVAEEDFLLAIVVESLDLAILGLDLLHLLDLFNVLAMILLRELEVKLILI
jgi:hypothetical protein